MKKIIFLPLVVLFLSGCSTFSNMEDGLKSLMGKEDQVAFDVLGYPSQKQQFGDDTVYTWNTSRSGVTYTPQAATTYTTTGYATTTYSQATPYNYHCTIKLISRNGRLYKWQYDGNIGGCGGYSNSLKKYNKNEK